VRGSEHSRDGKLSRAYAAAAYQHTTGTWLSELNTVRDRLATDPALLADLNNRELDFAKRQARFDVILPSTARTDVKNFLYTLLREGHLGMLDTVIADLARMVAQRSAAQVAHVTSAVPLTPDEQEAVRQRVHARYGSEVELDFRVDPSILGGVIVQVGDKVIDGSIAGRLTALHERLAAVR
jgi:F-type H+-transporting ATPase subunit delta